MSFADWFALARQRLAMIHKLEDWFETPMAVLSAVWLGLMIVELAWGLNRFGERMTVGIWVLFIIDFMLRLALAPRKLRYLRRNWLTAVSLLLPALRVLRIGRVFRALARLRGLQLVRVLGSINRGMKTLGKTMQRRGLGYVAALTLIVTFAGAAGMYFFERDLPGGAGFESFWGALWWTAMMITTMGSEYWPKTPEGRTLCLFLSIYSFSMFSYFTGTLATYFIGRDAEESAVKPATQDDVAALMKEIGLLRQALAERQRAEP